MHLHFRRKARFNFGDCPNIRVGVGFVLLNFVSIGSPKNLNTTDIFRLDVHLNVGDRREEPKIEGFKDIFLNVLLVDRAEVVESLDVLEHLTRLGLKLSRNANDGGVDVVGVGIHLQKLLVLPDAGIANVS